MSKKLTPAKYQKDPKTTKKGKLEQPAINSWQIGIIPGGPPSGVAFGNTRQGDGVVQQVGKDVAGEVRIAGKGGHGVGVGQEQKVVFEKG